MSVDIVEPLIVVASLIVTAGVFISTLVTIEETDTFGRVARLANQYARLLCIPLPVTATIFALFYVIHPILLSWLPSISFGLIVIDLLLILVFCIAVIPMMERKPTPWSIEYLLPRFKDAQSLDLENLRQLAIAEEQQNQEETNE